MNNIVIIGILFIFAIIIARVAWNNKLKYSYTDAELGATKQKDLKDLQQLTDAEILAVEDSMHQAGGDVIKRNVKNRVRSRSLSEMRDIKEHARDLK
ncbi:hypothetical protein EXVG_00041 [Emiliania huxleyi virus 202]|nr:hypothetical protein EXVG_00041 [Emiliania huxleyi virus 202]AHA54511.1 putative membrane protein [Emiliania huxleyi virus 18]AHA55551.1 putative membrane protein [Emiliania huxleyi virus 156]